MESDISFWQFIAWVVSYFVIGSMLTYIACLICRACGDNLTFSCCGGGSDDVPVCIVFWPLALAAIGLVGIASGVVCLFHYWTLRLPEFVQEIKDLH